MKPILIARERVSACYVQTNLSRLLERIEQGQCFVITRHGKPVAQLVPFEEDDAAVRQAIDKVASIRAALAREGVTLAGILEENGSLRDLSHAGHHY